MCDPGSADLSADVDFSFLKQAILQGSGMLQCAIILQIYIAVTR